MKCARTAAAVAAVLLLFTVPTLSAGTLEIHHIDVEQGDATLVIGPNGTTILIDAGPNSYYSSADGGEIVFEYLEALGLAGLDMAVATHADADHTGGYAYGYYATSAHSVILADRESGAVKSRPGATAVDEDTDGWTDFIGDDGCGADAIDVPDPEEIAWGGLDIFMPWLAFDNGEETWQAYCGLTKTFRRYVQTVESAGIRETIPTYQALMDLYNNPIDLGDGATARFVCGSGWVAGNPVQVDGADGADDENARSLGLYIEYGMFDYLVAGDLTGNEGPDMEQALRDLLVTIDDSPAGDPVDVLRLNHHGSNTSSEQSFLDDLKPEVAVISVGDSSAYGFPAQEVLDRLSQNYGDPLACVYSTETGEETRDWHGMCREANYAAGVLISTDGTCYTINNASGGVDTYPTDDPLIHQGAESEAAGTCGDGIDNDCDGLVDGDDPDCGGTCFLSGLTH